MRDELKHWLIEQYLLPALDLTVKNNTDVLAELYQSIKLLRVVKYQVLETPEDEGRLWLPIDAMVHAYHYCEVGQCPQGIRIWRKLELILQPASLFGQQPLTDYIETLEGGRVLSIGYPVLRKLMAGCPPLFGALLKAGIANERYYHQQSKLLQMSNSARLLVLKKEIPLFIRIACQRLVAMHTGMPLRTYCDQLKKMNRKKKPA
uniref:hypothetical protein n=1 Tax=Pedobacter schmidteae TaxID=2201271 RepID=UPI000EB02028|nr:hypothetical protein [Pedobacter schmidteae]